MLMFLEDRGFWSKARRVIRNLSAQHRHIPDHEHIWTGQSSSNPQNSTDKLACYQTCQSSESDRTGDDADT